MMMHHNGAATIDRTSLSMMTLTVGTLSLVTLSINDIQHDIANDNNTKRNAMFFIVRLTVTVPSDIMPSGIIPSIFMLNVIVLGVSMLGVIMLNIVMVSVIMLIDVILTITSAPE